MGSWTRKHKHVTSRPLSQADEFPLSTVGKILLWCSALALWNATCSLQCHRPLCANGNFACYEPLILRSPSACFCFWVKARTVFFHMKWICCQCLFFNIFIKGRERACIKWIIILEALCPLVTQEKLSDCAILKPIVGVYRIWKGDSPNSSSVLQLCECADVVLHRKVLPSKY